MSPLYALLLSPAQGGGASMLPFIVQMGAIFAIFYFLLIRPQQKQKQQHEASLRELKKGDRIVTAGGIIGEVVHIRVLGSTTNPGSGLEDEVTIRSGESKVIVERGRIARIARAQGTAA
ncbi:MAG: yajC [Gemmatimonadetes bacterium]|nr:yajC [Gemmatimonadota bacterium]